MNYAEPDFLKRLTRRRTTAKRRAALLEHVLAQRVAQAFFLNRREAHERLVAAFLGVDAAAGRELDGTL